MFKMEKPIIEVYDEDYEREHPTEFNLSEKLVDAKTCVACERTVRKKDIKEFIKRNNDIDNEIADEIFRLQQMGMRIDVHLIFQKAQDKRNKLSGDKFI